MFRAKDEEGQSIILVVLAMGIFLIGAVGLGFDGSHLYSERMRAQLAADSAAQAGILSLFDGTDISGHSGYFPTTRFTCDSYPTSTPCKYASYGGFSSTAGDTITVTFPTSAAGVTLSGSDPTNLIHVEISRDVPTTLMRLLGPTAATIKAVATAAIVDVNAPIPILITHPSLDKALLLAGTGSITICGGPSRSIQVNSGAGYVSGETGDAFAPQGSGGGSVTIDLSHAGPLDTNGDCTLGTGADMGVWGLGNSSSIANVTLGSGKYLAKASPIQDPLSGVSPPDEPMSGGSPLLGTQTAMAANTSVGSITCPSSSAPQGCTLLTPGVFPNGIIFNSTTVLVEPGIYYINGSQKVSGVWYDFSCTSGCNMQMTSGVTDTITGTGWDGTQAGGGALFYLTGPTTGGNYGGVNIGSSGSVSLVGSKDSSRYEGMLFFEDHSAPALTHNLGGNGSMILNGTIYLTNYLSTMTGDSTHYQALTMGGTSGNNTRIRGEIIVGQLTLNGTPNITMNLNPNTNIIVRRVALVQ